MPDERLMANATMSEEDVSCVLSQAAAWIDHADALLIGSGTGLPVNSAFWVPEVRQWEQKAPLGCFFFTSNIASHWIALGFDSKRVIEIHGAAYAQCALATCSLSTFKPFSLSLGKVGTISIVGGTGLQCLQETGAPGPRKPRSS